MKEGTADSQLPHKINSRNNTVPLHEPREDPKEQAKEPRINFSADPDFEKCIRIRAYQLVGIEAADLYAALARQVQYRYFLDWSRPSIPPTP